MPRWGPDPMRRKLVLTGGLGLVIGTLGGWGFGRWSPAQPQDDPVKDDSPIPLVRDTRERYVVLVSEENRRNLSDVIGALEAKHKDKLFSVVTFGTNGDTLRAAIPELHSTYPTMVSYVTDWRGANEHTIRELSRMMTELQPGGYPDALWGVVTGLNQTDMLSLVQPTALSIDYLLQKAIDGKWDQGRPLDAGSLEWVKQGFAMSDTIPGLYARKAIGNKASLHMDGDPDDTAFLVEMLNTTNIDMLLTSGHANERVWMLGYNMPDGVVFARNGDLLARAHGSNTDLRINSTHPKIIYPAGSCLAGNIKDENSLALAFIRSAGAKLFLGALQPVSLGYIGWGVRDYFFALQDTFTFPEAVLCNMLSREYDERHPAAKFYGNRPPEQNKRRLAQLRREKHAHCLYGDIIDARIAKEREPKYTTTVTASHNGDEVELEITINLHVPPREIHRHPIVLLRPDQRMYNPTVAGKSSLTLRVEVQHNFVLLNIAHEGDASSTRFSTVVRGKYKGPDRNT